MGDHRVLALDLPGFGDSEMPREAISIQRYASGRRRAAGRARRRAAAVVGNSMGGFVGAELALRSRSACERLVLVSAAISGRPTGARAAAAARAAERPSRRGRRARPDGDRHAGRGCAGALRARVRYPENALPGSATS